MAKRIREKEAIYIAPYMLGLVEDGSPIVLDERSKEELNPYSLKDKILIYERQVNEWFLKRAKELVKQDDGYGFIVLMICLSYLEGVEQFKTGVSSNGSSRDFFVNAMVKLYEKDTYSKNNLELFYNEARCGLFHNGMVKSRIIISYSYENTLNFQDEDTIKVNPQLFLDDIENDFNKYILSLKKKENASLRLNFSQLFSVI